MSSALIQGSKLGRSYKQSGISLMTPSELVSEYQRLPPMLHNLYKRSMPGYSKGSRGLSV